MDNITYKKQARKKNPSCVRAYHTIQQHATSPSHLET